MTILSRVNRINDELTAENIRLRHEIKVLVADNMKWRHEAGKLLAAFRTADRLIEQLALTNDTAAAARKKVLALIRETREKRERNENETGADK